ncbi:hypothetical protein [Clostridium sp. ZBS17]|uniref:hypothetical protein n=1 Tax=Clostridium sp. ZBS17 TaxID=2949968 RepID=UPI00207A0F89|nr:hypothetical protein [Clostridium sp. ZBS17]
MRDKSNFFFVQGTSIGEIYNDLELAEQSFEKDPGNTILKLGKVNEYLVRNIVKIYNIKYSDTESMNNLINTICPQNNIHIPKSINNFMNKIRIERNGEIHIVKYSQKQTSTIVLLKDMHEILKWYLQDLTKQTSKDKVLEFESPINFNEDKNNLEKNKQLIEDKNKEIKKLKGELDKKTNNNINIDQIIEKLDDVTKDKISLEKKCEELYIENKKSEINLEKLKQECFIEHEDKIEKIKQDINVDKEKIVIEVQKIKEKVEFKNRKIENLNLEIMVLKKESQEQKILKEQLDKISLEKIELNNKYNELVNSILDYDNYTSSIEKKYKDELENKIKEITQKNNNGLEKNSFQLKELKSIIQLKEKEILDQELKIKNLKKKSEEIDKINNKLLKFQKEKIDLSNNHNNLKNKLEAQENELHELREKYQKDIEELIKKDFENKRILREERNKSQQILVEKEKLLIKSEQENMKLKNKIQKLQNEKSKELLEKDKQLKLKEKLIKEKLMELTGSYKNCFNETKKYQDILEKSGFTYDDETKAKLNLEIIETKEKILNHITSFDDNFKIYKTDIEEANEELINMKRVINEKTFNNKENAKFYKAFLEIQGNSLKILYVMLIKVNAGSILLNKSKEFLFSTNEDEIMQYINKKVLELKELSDDEIRIKLYYKLILLSNIKVKNLLIKEEFLGVLDSIIDNTYSMIKYRESFKERNSKLQSIYTYCLDKVIQYFEEFYIDNDITKKENLINNIYINFKKIDNDKKLEICKKLKLNYTTEVYVKSIINSNPKEFIATVMSVGGFVSIFFIDAFIRSLFNISEVVSFNQTNKIQQEIIPVFLMQLLLNIKYSNNKKIIIDNYYSMCDMWKNKKNQYNILLKQKNIKKIHLNGLLKEKEKIELNIEKLSLAKNKLFESYYKEREVFDECIIKSDKLKELPSYNTYVKLLEKSNKIKDDIRNKKEDTGRIKSMVSIDIWEDKVDEFFNEGYIIDIKKALLDEAKESITFEKEYKVISDTENNLKKVKLAIKQNKQILYNKKEGIQNLRFNINKIDNECREIETEYIDICSFDAQ